MKLTVLLKEWVLEALDSSDKLEADHLQLHEIKIDPLNSYNYQKINIPFFTNAYSFEDRCGNTIVAMYLEGIGEFKTGYKIEGVDTLVFQPERLPDVEKYIKPCPDDKKIGTVYKILTQEIIPNHLLNKKPNKLFFNPVSDSRARVVDLIINRAVKDYPELTKKESYLIYK